MGKNLNDLLLFLTWAASSILFASCATSPREKLWQTYDKSKARPAAYAAEGFSIHSRSPEPRPVQDLDFYFKDCTIVGRSTLPTRHLFECTGPR